MGDRGMFGVLIRRETVPFRTPQDLSAAEDEHGKHRLRQDGAPDCDVAGVVFAGLSVLPALLATPWLIAGVLLLAVGSFRPIPVTCLAAVLAVPVLYYGLRTVSVLPGPEAHALPMPPERPRAHRPSARTPWWTVATVLAIVIAFFGYQVAYHSQQVLFTRDPGGYYQFAVWIARHGSLGVPQDAAAFGGYHGGSLVFFTGGTYPAGNSLSLQFMAGLPMVLAGVMWAAGYHAALLVPALLGALAILTFAGLAARLIGARWAPLAALVIAVSLPMQFTSRSAYSEPLAEILLLGGLILVIDSLRDHAGAAPSRRIAAALSGLLLGLTVLVRIDGASDILPVIPFCGALFVRRRPQAAPLAIGLTAGVAIGLTEGLVFSWPYLMQTNGNVMLPLAGIAAVVLAGTAAGTVYDRSRSLPRWWGWLDKAGLAAPFLVMAAFGVRPYVQHVRAWNYTGQVARTYAEISLHWVGWYLGIPVILLATVGAALLTRMVLRGQARFWVLPLMMLAWAAVTFLYRPGVAPDQPWASRRLVPAVMPAFVLLAVWALARGSAWLRDHWHRSAPRNVAMALCGLLVVAPAVVTNWGLGPSTSHGIGISLRSDGLADKRTYQGELNALERLCTMLPAHSAVVFVSAMDAGLIEQPVRSMCGVPAAAYMRQGGKESPGLSDAPGVLSVVRDIQRTGRVPVLLSYNVGQLRPYLTWGTAKPVLMLRAAGDARSIHNPPTAPVHTTIDVWMWTPSPNGKAG